MTITRDEARSEFRAYLTKSGMTIAQLAEEIGYSYRTLLQWASQARFGTAKPEGDETSSRVLAWLRANPLPAPELPGKLYETRATREMDQILRAVANGAWGILYGPSGSQKTFLLEYRAAEAARESEPRIIYLRCSASGMTPSVFLRRVAAGLGAAYGATCEALRRSILIALRRRRASLALVLDEADHLYRQLDTLETLRELGDLARARPGRPGLGILIAGNERVWQIFENRRSVYLEKWRARIEDEKARVIGPSQQEAAAMLAGELGALKAQTIEAILRPPVVTEDPESRRTYVNAHRLFRVIAKMRNGRALVN